MTKEQAVQMGEEVMAAAKIIAAKYGMDVKRGSGRYGDSEYKLNNLTFFEKGETGSEYSKSDEEIMGETFDFYAKGFGITEKCGFEYWSDDHKSMMKIVGWKKANRKYPVLVKNIKTGGIFKMTAQSLKLYLEDLSR